MSDHHSRRRLSTPKLRIDRAPDDLDTITSHLQGLDREQLEDLAELATGFLRLIGYLEAVLDVHDEHNPEPLEETK